MQIVIEMSDDYYEILKYEGQQPNAHVFAKLVANGIVLPKGHGKIIDESVITEVYAYKTEPKEVNGIQIYPRIEIIGTNAPTIIEADRSEE